MNMSKRRIDPKRAKKIAEERMDRLLRISAEQAVLGNDSKARRYVELARRIGMKTKTPIPKDIRYCKGCMMPLVPGTSCVVRLRNHKVVMRCTRCGCVRRIPYIKEQRDDREGCQKGAHEKSA